MPPQKKDRVKAQKPKKRIETKALNRKSTKLTKTKRKIKQRIKKIEEKSTTSGSNQIKQLFFCPICESGHQFFESLIYHQLDKHQSVLPMSKSVDIEMRGKGRSNDPPNTVYRDYQQRFPGSGFPRFTDEIVDLITKTCPKKKRARGCQKEALSATTANAWKREESAKEKQYNQAKTWSFQCMAMPFGYYDPVSNYQNCLQVQEGRDWLFETIAISSAEDQSLETIQL